MPENVSRNNPGAARFNTLLLATVSVPESVTPAQVAAPLKTALFPIRSPPFKLNWPLVLTCTVPFSVKVCPLS